MQRAFGVGIRAASQAYRKSLGSLAPDSMDRDTFSSYVARFQRYRLAEALWENTAYDSGLFGVHAWAKDRKVQRGIYRYCRGVYNPVYRGVEFWASTLYGGALDPEVGDGVNRPSAIPIATPRANPELRRGVGLVWEASRWPVKKSVFGRHGALFGDSQLVIRPDTALGRVRMEPIKPRSVVDATFDAYGNVAGYCIEEQRPDPRATAHRAPGELPDTVTYAEHCERTPAGVRFATFLDGRPFDWRGHASGEQLPPEWELPWPFVPMVWVQHLDLGRDAGVSEYHAAEAKIVEADDQGSKIGDHIRRMVETKWFFSGFTDKDLRDVIERSKASEAAPEAGREQERTISARDVNAKVTAMVTELRVREAGEHVRSILEQLELDYPELKYQQARVAGDASAKALREIAKTVKTKVNERRASYDPQLVRAQRMALAIGGDLGFPGFEAFRIEDFDGPATEHSIGSRPAFDVEDLDRIEEDTAEAQAAKTWTEAGVPLEFALERAGWPADLIARVTAAREAAAAREAEEARSRAPEPREQ